MVGLTNKERCLIRSQHIGKRRGSERITEMFSNTRTHLICKYLIVNAKVVQTVQICGVLQFIRSCVDVVERGVAFCPSGV